MDRLLLEGYSRWRRLTKRIIKFVRLDEEHELGQLRIDYGSSLALKDLRWNKRWDLLWDCLLAN